MCTEMLAAGPIGPVSCDVGLPWMGLDCLAHPTDAQSDSDLQNLESGLFLKALLDNV